MANKHMERCSISLVTRIMNIKATVRDYYNPLEPLKFKKIGRPYKAGVSKFCLQKDPRYFRLHWPYGLCQTVWREAAEWKQPQMIKEWIDVALLFIKTNGKPYLDLRA